MGATERNDPIEVEATDEAAGGAGFRAPGDRRPRMPEPLPVKVLAVEDVRLPATAGLESQLDDFYVGLLEFERVDVELPRPRPKVEPMPGVRQDGREWPMIRRGRAGLPLALTGADRPHTFGPVYRAENFRVHFDLVEGLVERESLRPLGVEVPSLAATEGKLTAAEIEYVRQRGVTPGQESLLLTDPAGNWIELVGMRQL
jgi:hypothetical protein